MSPDHERRYEQSLEIDAPPEAVWKAVGEPREIERWFADRVEMEPRAGGESVWEWHGFGAWKHRVEVYEPGRRLALVYDSTVDDGAGGKVPLFVDFLVEGRGGRTLLRLVHSGFGADARFDEEFDGISRGWSVELESLRLYVERHRGEERTRARVFIDVDGTAAQAWDRLVSPEGLGPAFDRLKDGDRFALSLGGALPIEGRVLHRPVREEVSAVLENLGDAFLRVAVERCNGKLQAWAWLALYGDAARRAAEAQAALDALATRLFPGARVDSESGVRA